MVVVYVAVNGIYTKKTRFHLFLGMNHIDPFIIRNGRLQPRSQNKQARTKCLVRGQEAGHLVLLTFPGGAAVFIATVLDSPESLMFAFCRQSTNVSLVTIRSGM